MGFLGDFLFFWVLLLSGCLTHQLEQRIAGPITPEWNHTPRCISPPTLGVVVFFGTPLDFFWNLLENVGHPALLAVGQGCLLTHRTLADQVNVLVSFTVWTIFRIIIESGRHHFAIRITYIVDNHLKRLAVGCLKGNIIVILTEVDCGWLVVNPLGSPRSGSGWTGFNSPRRFHSKSSSPRAWSTWRAYKISSISLALTVFFCAQPTLNILNIHLCSSWTAVTWLGSTDSSAGNFSTFNHSMSGISASTFGDGYTPGTLGMQRGHLGGFNRHHILRA